jgi:hypothetical protein
LHGSGVIAATLLVLAVLPAVCILSAIESSVLISLEIPNR